MSDHIPTSPTLPAGQDTFRTAKAFGDAMTLDLTDAEIAKAMMITKQVHTKHRTIWRRKFPFDSFEQIGDLLGEFEKELSHRMAEELDCLVRVDGTPCFEGQGPTVEWMGRIDTSSFAKVGLDHEQKEWEVKKANRRDEDYLGQKGTPGKNE